jgi:type II secretory pathway component PulF
MQKFVLIPDSFKGTLSSMKICEIGAREIRSLFPDAEIVGDLIIYADMNGFDQNLNRVANDYLNESVRKMEKVSSVLNSFGILLVSAIIAWVVLGTFQMQDQITAALS